MLVVVDGRSRVDGKRGQGRKEEEEQGECICLQVMWEE